MFGVVSALSSKVTKMKKLASTVQPTKDAAGVGVVGEDLPGVSGKYPTRSDTSLKNFRRFDPFHSLRATFCIDRRGEEEI